MNRKEIIKKLNHLFYNYESLIKFCDILSNDIDKIVMAINKLLKYAFVSNNFCNSVETLESFAVKIEHGNLNEIDEKYKLYLEKNKKNFFSFFKRKKDTKINSDIPLDEDIKTSDLEGLILPFLCSFEEICNMNIQKNKIGEEKKRLKTIFYKEQRGFEEVGFTYQRAEFITINNDFIYCDSQLTGDIDDDYNYLYGGERYVGKNTTPLNNDFFTNLQEVKEMNDISLIQFGNVWQFHNGRHRIIYLLKSGREVTIPVSSVERRIEDRELNNILIELKTTYGVNIYKNNILNDDANLLLAINGYAYIIHNKEELLKFNDCLKNNKYDIFLKISFVDKQQYEDEDLTKYRVLLLKKYFEFGDCLFKKDFTDILKIFPNENNYLLYIVFNDIKQDYQKSKVFGIDFHLYCKEQIKSNLKTLDFNRDDIEFSRE